MYSYNELLRNPQIVSAIRFLFADSTSVLLIFWNMLKDLSLESTNIQTQNYAPIQCTVWPRIMNTRFPPPPVNIFVHMIFQSVHLSINRRILSFSAFKIPGYSFFVLFNFFHFIGFKAFDLYYIGSIASFGIV